MMIHYFKLPTRSFILAKAHLVVPADLLRSSPRRRGSVTPSMALAQMPACAGMSGEGV